MHAYLHCKLIYSPIMQLKLHIAYVKQQFLYALDNAFNSVVQLLYKIVIENK